MHQWFQNNIKRHLQTVDLHPLQKMAVCGLGVLVGVMFAQGTIGHVVHKHVDRFVAAVLPSVVIELTNEERDAHHVGSLRRSTQLDEAARRKAVDMREHHYFAHFSPEGISPWHWFDTVEYAYVHAGENIAIYFDDSAEVVSAWMDSPLHKENIIKAEYTEIGVAAVAGVYEGFDTVYIVQLFGTPAPQQVPTHTVRNVTDRVERVPVVSTTGTEDVLGEVAAATVVVPPETPAPVLDVGQFAVETQPALAQEIYQEPASEFVSVGTRLALVAGHLSTSSGAVSADVAEQSAEAPGVTEEEVAPSKTNTTLQLVYIFLAALVLGVLVVSVLHAQRHRRYVQAIYGLALLALTLLLMLLYAKLG